MAKCVWLIYLTSKEHILCVCINIKCVSTEKIKLLKEIEKRNSQWFKLTMIYQKML